MNSTVRLHNHFGAARATLRDYLHRTVCATGKDIAEKTRENMYPGHFYDTGLSEQTTTWEQLAEDAGQVRIPTAYAAYPELGTSRMAPRPALTPAIEELWPEAARRNWEHADLLPPIDPPGPAMPAIDKNGNPL